jgi:general secretion pathway protein D
MNAAHFSRSCPPVLRALTLACALAIGALPALSPAQPQTNGKNAATQELVTLNFVNADIPSVVKAIGGSMGKTFIFDPNVTGTVNIVSDKPVSKDLAYDILLAALRVQGFAAVEGNGYIKIVREADAKITGSAPGVRASGDRIITKVFHLQNESAQQMATVLRPMVSPNNYLAAFAGNNAIVVTDYAENVQRIGSVIASLDMPASADVQVIRLQHASAVDVGNLLTKLMPEASPNPTTPGQPPKLVLGTDPRTNSLLLRADTPALTTRVKTLIAGMDIPTASNGNIHVVYLRNAEATKLAETLRGLLAAEKSAVPTAQVPATIGTTSSGASSTAASASQSSPTSSIQAYAATNSLVITAPDYVYNSLRSVIDKLDARRAQVFIEALIVEVNSTTTAEFGIQWQDLTGLAKPGSQLIGGTNFGAAGQNIIGAALDPTSLGAGLNIGVVRGTVRINGKDIIGLNALARALEADNTGNILSKPNILTLDNEEGKIVVGQTVPFITGSFTQTTTGTSGTNPFQTIERKDVGITLKVTPQVAEGGAVKMKVFQEVSSVVPTTTNVKSADLITNKRSIENTVLVDDGNIVVIGGLIADDTKHNESKVPILGDIPILGNFFKYQDKNRAKTNLMVFLRPVVLRDGKAAQQLTGDRYDYIRNEQGNFNANNANLLPPIGGAELPPMDAKPGAK